MAYETGDIYWPVTLLNELEGGGQGRCFDWVAACAMTFFERVEVDNRSLLAQWVRDVIVAKENRNPLGLREKSLEIWHARRDQLHTTVSHLYAALHYLLEGDYREYRKTIFYAVSAMSRDPGFSHTGLSVAREAFAKMQPGTGPMP